MAGRGGVLCPRQARGTRGVSRHRLLSRRAVFLIAVAVSAQGALASSPFAASSTDTQSRPFRLPFVEPPGPDTWLLLQPYGNTTFAYTYRRLIYGSGQGLHFGIDLAARCGTPVVAIGDGVVSEVDNARRGAGPHNLMIDHPNGYASFYGHLLGRPNVQRGLQVRAGQVVGLSGDPDQTCTGRPHLHLEIRNAPAHSLAYNPILLIEADWERIALVGAFPVGFERDLNDPHRWQALDDQPLVNFYESLVNDYAEAWPSDW